MESVQSQTDNNYCITWPNERIVEDNHRANGLKRVESNYEVVRPRECCQQLMHLLQKNEVLGKMNRPNEFVQDNNVSRELDKTTTMDKNKVNILLYLSAFF